MKQILKIQRRSGPILELRESRILFKVQGEDCIEWCTVSEASASKLARSYMFEKEEIGYGFMAF